jgi:hypothetical protein
MSRAGRNLKQKFHGGRVSLEKGKDNGILHWQCATLCKEKRQRCGAVRAHLEENFDGLMFPALDYCEPSHNDWEPCYSVLCEGGQSCGGPMGVGYCAEGEPRLDRSGSTSDDW